jgi:predicted RNA-binding protein with TRAM domain
MSGQYFVELRDVRYQGGARFHYRLKMGDFNLERSPYLPIQTLRTAFHREYSAVEELEPNESSESANVIAPPVVIQGQLHAPGDRDLFRFEAAEGARLIFESRSRSLGSPSDLRLLLRTLDGKRLAESNVSSAGETSLTNTFKIGGTVLLEVEELNQQGGRGHFYEIEVRPFRPGFTLNVETNLLHAAPGSAVKIKVTAVRSEYAGSITLQAYGSGVAWSVEDAVIPGNGNETQLRITVPPDFPSGGVQHIQIIGHGEAAREKPFAALASTRPHLRRLFSNQVYPPRELDGWISVALTEPALPQEENAPTSNP